MVVRFDLPEEVLGILQGSSDDLNQTFKEAALVELYRQDQISQRDLSLALGITRLETEELLKRHDVTEDLPTEEEIRRAVEHLSEAHAK